MNPVKFRFSLIGVLDPRKLLVITPNQKLKKKLTAKFAIKMHLAATKRSPIINDKNLEFKLLGVYRSYKTEITSCASLCFWWIKIQHTRVIEQIMDISHDVSSYRVQDSTLGTKCMYADQL